MNDNTKRAVIVGGSNGIGLAVSHKLAEQGYHVDILDKVEPNIKPTNYSFNYFDLLDYDEEFIKALACRKEIDTLFITAGFGRVADFENLHTCEIENLLKVNTISTLKIIKNFFERIKSSEKFYCGVVGSIAGLVSSPMFSVYAASKAAICRFVESVNIELEEAGCQNRILNVSPGSINGTKFNNGENQLNLLYNLSEQIIKYLFDSNELLIPDYDTIYCNVIERYKANPHSFGLNSYRYKKDSMRAEYKKQVCIGYLSGTFDLFHVGHLNIIKRAKSQCDYLIVGVHASGKHKGKETFIPFDERKSILSSIKYVDKVIDSCVEDSDTWNIHRYDKLFVGSDYKGSPRFIRYEEYFKDKDVEIIFFPYTESTSSSQMRELISSLTKSE